MSQPLLSAAQIFESQDLKEETIDVPEWGGPIRLVQMTAAESAELTKKIAASESGMYLMVIFSAKNEQGERIFTEEDVERLKLKNFNTLNLLQRRALALNAQTEQQKEALKKA